MRKQPVFYPGKKLRADDLISLEEYTFSRTNIISPDHGVVNLFNNGTQPAHRQDRESYYFIITEVAGITPSGRPIKFKTSADRDALKVQFPVYGHNFLWDIYIDDEHPEGKGTANENGEKYSLSKTPVLSETDKPQIIPNKLYIGRYKLTKDAPPEIIAWPYIYNLASFSFPSEKWQDWTYPIRDALRRIVDKHKNPYVHDFVKNITYSYPFMPLSQLLRACNQLAWLCNEAADIEEILQEDKMANLQQSLITDPLPQAVYNIPPNEIPAKIAQIIGGGADKLWNLIVQSLVNISEDKKVITIDKKFLGAQEIKFRFKPGISVQEWVKLRVDNFFSFEAQREEEHDNNNNKCSCFIITYPGNADGEKFTLTLPAGWKTNEFSIYYRMLIS